MSNKQVLIKDKKSPSILGLAGYILLIVLLGIMAIFSKQLAQSVNGPVLCIYISVLPKYIFGLALILAGVDGVAYAIRFFKEYRWLPMAASGIQLIALTGFLLFIFPLAVIEGVPAGQTYNLMRLLIGVMIIVTAWDFIIEFRKVK